MKSRSAATRIKVVDKLQELEDCTARVLDGRSVESWLFRHLHGKGDAEVPLTDKVALYEAREISALPATELQRHLHDGSLSAEDVVNAVLAQIDRFDPELNAFALVDRDGVRAARAGG